ncbi:MAG: PrsW family intramembrane metalloprotease [Methanomicrobiales archaeon]|nr:PrsW family intramembrane metalloprotease [Methanomicrobiales archaeon]
MPPSLFIVAVLIAFGVALFFLWWVRRIEVNHREPWTAVLLAFLVGAVVTVILGAFLESLLLIPLQNFVMDFLPIDVRLIGFLGAVFVAPVAEESMKALGILTMRSRIREVEDGIVYGAAVGLGFAATENVLYFASAISTGGAIAFAGTAVIRSLTSTLLHLGATGLSGYGFGLYYGHCRGKPRWGIYVFAAMVFHGFFNLLASLQLFSGMFLEQITLGLTALLLAVILVWSLFAWLQNKLKYLDRMSPTEIPEC